MPSFASYNLFINVETNIEPTERQRNFKHQVSSGVFRAAGTDCAVVVLGSIPCDNVKVNRKAKALKFSASHQVKELADVTSLKSLVFPLTDLLDLWLLH